MKKIYFGYKALHKDLLDLPPYTYTVSHKLSILPIWIVDEIRYNAFISLKERTKIYG